MEYIEYTFYKMYEKIKYNLTYQIIYTVTTISINTLIIFAKIRYIVNDNRKIAKRYKIML